MRKLVLGVVVAAAICRPAWAQYPYPQCAERAAEPMADLVQGARALAACFDEIEKQGEPLIVCERYRDFRPVFRDALKCRVEAVYFYGDAATRFPNYKPPADQQRFMDLGAPVAKAARDAELSIRIRFPGFLPDDASGQ